LEQLGLQGIVGIVFLVLAGAFLILGLNPLERETALMHSHLAVDRPKTITQARTFSLGDRQNELGAFFDSLPEEADVTDILASIYSIAEENGVDFKQAEYHLNDKGRPLIEYGIVFPVQGEYAKIRFLISKVLVSHPAIALDQINFQRDKINSPILKAEIKLTLFLNPKVGEPR
jgi:hypothetical protein